jgi:hypothetical protein
MGQGCHVERASARAGLVAVLELTGIELIPSRNPRGVELALMLPNLVASQTNLKCWVSSKTAVEDL